MSFEIIFNAVLNGDAPTAVSETEAALQAGEPAGEILQKGLIAAMNRVGQLFEEGEIFVPEMLVAARAMQKSLNLLRPHLVEGESSASGKIIVGTVSGDLHDIGKNLVCMMFEGAGFEVIDLGVDVSVERFVEAVRAHQPHILGMSALLTTTMTSMPLVIEALNVAGLRHGLKIMIGGAPVTQDFADEIGADGYAPDASRATRRAKELLGISE